MARGVSDRAISRLATNPKPCQENIYKYITALETSTQNLTSVHNKYQGAVHTRAHRNLLIFFAL
jgi:hypothetical protein